MQYKCLKTENYQDFLGRIYGSEFKTKHITFQITEDCCMACTYCYQHNKTKNKMSFKTAKNFIDNLYDNKYYLATSENTNGIILEFIGGEPFLEIDLIVKIVDYYFEEGIKRNHPWISHTMISICSNGLLYFEQQVQDFIYKYRNILSFTISIDGNKELHDSCRIDVNGQGTYDRAMAAVKHYRKTYSNYIGTKITLFPQNICFLYESIKDLVKEGYTELFCNCVFENVWSITDASIFYQELIKIADYLIDNDLYSQVYLSLFDEDIGQPMEGEDNENWCGGVFQNLNSSGFSISPQGDIYPCIRYMESSLNHKQSPLKIGSVFNLIGNNQEDYQNILLLNNITRRSQSTDECYYCLVAKGCSWCSAYNYEEFGTPNKRATYICNMHKARVLANNYYWNKLYNKLQISKKYINNLSEIDINKIIKGG